MKFICNVVAFIISCSHAFHLPALAPKTYCVGNVEGCPNTLDVYVNRLNSVRSVLPFDYKRFPFCEPEDELPAPGENLGQVLFGERITPAPFKLEYLKDTNCKVICKKLTLIPGRYSAKLEKDKMTEYESTQLLMRAIQLNYQQHWIADNLPMVFCYKVQPIENGPILEHCDRSFPIGCYVNKDGQPKDFCNSDSRRFQENEAFYLFNHVDIVITYHPANKSKEWLSTLSDADHAEENKAGRIVGIRITVSSVKQTVNKDGTCQVFSNYPPMYIKQNDTAGEESIPYSYSVIWVANTTVKWSSRWDYILKSLHGGDIQWFQIVNSLVIVLFMSGMIAMILFRKLHRDINNQENLEDAQKRFGWKLVHGDVFRPPAKGMLLSVFLGNGVQLFFMCLITLFFACMGFLSPANRGFLMTCAVVCYVLMGTPAGYSSARIYKMFGGEKWKSNVMLTAFLVPGMMFGAFLLLNLVLWGERSSAAVPCGTLVAVLALWFCVSAPLTFLGAYFGFKRTPIENSVRTNQIPRKVPPQPCYTRPVPCVLMGAVLPFGCIFLQLFFILNSVWFHHVYYMFGFLFLVFVILVITSAETAILLCYFHLRVEDYNWWWRSFMTTGFAAVYLFVYCIHFFVTKMTITDTASTFLFFGYTIMMVFVFFLITGSIGFLSCLWFIHIIYERNIRKERARKLLPDKIEVSQELASVCNSLTVSPVMSNYKEEASACDRDKQAETKSQNR